MNIFYLDPDPAICAKYHCDKHVIKMILETAQILQSTYHLTKSKQQTFYKPTHLGHPCVKWAAADLAHFKWLTRLGKELCKIYTKTRGRIHKCEQIIDYCEENPPKLPLSTFTEPPQVVSPDCKSQNTVKSYQMYYNEKRTKMDMQWKNRKVPYFMENL